MNLRYQHGYLRWMKRKTVGACWEYMWREQDDSGKRVRRTVVLGSIEDYPTRELAQAAWSRN